MKHIVETMHRFYIDKTNICETSTTISGTDANHIHKVLRLQPGDQIGLFDGTGREYTARIAVVAAEGIQIKIEHHFLSTTESPIKITVAQAFIKERKMDRVIRQLTELGISRWLPFFSERSVPRPNPKRLENRRQRWEKIVIEAMKQCRRAVLPKVAAAVSFDEMLRQVADEDLKLAFWETESNPMDIQQLVGNRRSPKTICFMIGPEGGFTLPEVEKAKDAGFVTVSLGPRILRAETATIAAGALIQFLLGDMGQKDLDKSRGA